MKTIQKRGSMSDYLSKNKENYQNKVFVFELIKKYEGKALRTESGFQAPKEPEIIQATGTVYYKYPNGDVRPRIIRYIPGENSIYKDEQTSDKDFPKKIPYIKFTNSRKIVTGNEGLLLDFMMAWDINETKQNRDSSKPIKFKLVDNTKIREVAYVNSDLYFEAETFCRKGDLDEVMAFARIKGVNMNQDSKDIRFDLIKHIDRLNPKKFIDDKNNPSALRKHFILQAIDKGYLVKNDAAQTISFASNPNAPIIRAPMGLDPVDEFVKATYTPAGQEQYDAIRAWVSPPVTSMLTVPTPTKKEIEQVVPPVVFVQPMITNPTESDEELFRLFDDGLRLGLIIQKKGYYKYEQTGCLGKSKFINILKADNVLLLALKKELSEKLVQA